MNERIYYLQIEDMDWYLTRKGIEIHAGEYGLYVTGEEDIRLTRMYEELIEIEMYNRFGIKWGDRIVKK